ncbi:MAG: ethanolamine utilization protein EutH [Firmicutes bacterium]|nr:ethanolamine utilization protein EutH [Bacillota bacterium]
MSFSEILMWIMAIGALIGGIDKIIGNKFGLGEKFEEGFNAMGALALGMVGMVCLSPVLSNVIAPIISPILSAIGSDPAIFGSILPNDTGGYSLALSLAQNQEAGLYSGLIVASMLGSTVTFSIPVGLNLIAKKETPYFAKGLVIGMITIPIGSIVGGFMAGYNAMMVIMNTIPVFIIAVILIIGLKFAPNKTMKGCLYFGNVVVVVITVGLVAAAFEYMTGIVLIPGMAPIEEAMNMIGTIAVVLLGTFPVLHLLTKILDKPLTAIGTKIGMDAVSTAGMIFSMANSIPVFKTMSDMTSKGKIINIAWMVCVAGALGDHLGFTAGVHPEAILPVVLSKIIGGIVAVILTLVLVKDTSAEDAESKRIEQEEIKKQNG